MNKLQDYTEIIGEDALHKLVTESRKLKDKKILHISSTKQGGGVAEILNSLVPLMNDVGINADWKVIKGRKDFFNVTKKIHNALQGSLLPLTNSEKRIYIELNESNASTLEVDADCVIVHDPQPLPLIKFICKKQPWIWRCHIDLSRPNQDVWEYIKPFIAPYDKMIISSNSYKKANLPLKQEMVYPAIDPISTKNRYLSEKEITRYITSIGLPMDKPIITQVSRMDIWKDPEGLLEVFRHVRELVNCRLVFCYASATDDPEGDLILSRVKDKVKVYGLSKEVEFINGEDPLLVNALQRYSDIVVQKSVKEGFCLAVTEALWKEKPVVGSRVGGIPIQIINGVDGFLVESHDIKGFSDKIVQILENVDLARMLGSKARKKVIDSFIITRLLGDYIKLITDLIR
jgi:trehalose synthase